MIAAIVIVVSNVALWFGFDYYQDYTTEQKIQHCVEKTLEDHPKLHMNDVRVACETVIR